MTLKITLGIIVVVVIISIVGIVWVLWGLKTTIKESGPVSVMYGPYYYKDKSLIIKQTFNVNRLAGISSMTNITVTYDKNLVFTSIYSFKDIIGLIENSVWLE